MTDNKHSIQELSGELVDTNEAAQILNRKPNTLRKWASLETGPLRPVRINGRLHWRMRELKKLVLGA